MSASRPIRGWCRLLIAAVSLTLVPQVPQKCAAQEAEPSLGDLARSLRKKAAGSANIIDNDNLNKVVDDAEIHRGSGFTSLFSATPAISVKISGPDVMCSLSYQNNSPSADALLLEDLPREELNKLDGPASIDGDTLQVSTHNGTAWEVRELVIGLTIVRGRDAGSLPGQAHLMPAAGRPLQDQDVSQKQPDATILLHLKGSAAPATTVIFRTALNFVLFPDQEWRWSILKAKGLPPQTQLAEDLAELPAVSTLNSRMPPELSPLAVAPSTARQKQSAVPFQSERVAAHPQPQPRGQ